MGQKKKIYIIAGEASGDLHASNLMRAILTIEKEVDFRFWGGDRMLEIQKDGLVKHIKDLAFMGFVEVLMNLRTILGNMKICKQDILKYKPDALILVDYPGFNLRIAEWAKEQGIPVHYYISPQVWAWKQSRVKKIKQCVDHMYVILPFEKPFYEQFDYSVEFVGHPLLDEIQRYYAAESSKDFRERNQLYDQRIIAVLPGSRKQEVSIKLPIMLEAAKQLKDVQVVIAGAPSLSPDFYKTFMKDEKIIFGQTYDLLANSHAAIVTSGTATLETALFKVPEVVCYKGSNISYQIAKRLIKVKFISLVNLIMDKEIVKELIQHECTAENIVREIQALIDEGQRRDEMLKSYSILESKLGGGGASKKVAQSLLKTIR